MATAARKPGPSFLSLTARHAISLIMNWFEELKAKVPTAR